MFQMMIDLSDINTLNALYMSISIGITLKFFWTRNVKDSFFGSISDSAKTKVIHPGVFQKINSPITQNVILLRVVKHIRRQNYALDDSEDPISCCFA